MPGKEDVGANFLCRHLVEMDEKGTDEKTDVTHDTPLLDCNQKTLHFRQIKAVEF